MCKLKLVHTVMRLYDKAATVCLVTVPIIAYETQHRGQWRGKWLNLTSDSNARNALLMDNYALSEKHRLKGVGL